MSAVSQVGARTVFGLFGQGRIRPGRRPRQTEIARKRIPFSEPSRLSTDAAACQSLRAWRIASPDPGRVAFGLSRTAMIALSSPIRTRIEAMEGIVIAPREVPGRVARDDVPGTPPVAIGRREHPLIRELLVLQCSRVIEQAVARH